jgi:hypothetical protein
MDTHEMKTLSLAVQQKQQLHMETEPCGAQCPGLALPCGTTLHLETPPPLMEDGTINLASLCVCLPPFATCVRALKFAGGDNRELTT